MASNGSRLASLNISSRFEIPVLQSPRTPSSASIREHLSLDPLLADLSPSTVLEAFRNADNPPQTLNSRAKLLTESIAEASTHERALGIRAALAGKRVRDWATELEQWNWPRGAFETPLVNREHEYWGSLHKEVVLEREERLQRIKEGLVLLETEDLKNHVRNIHLGGRSRTIPQSPDSPQSPTSASYDHLADFHVIVTAIITQTLPELMTLTRLMGDWSVRISVLKRVSTLGQEMSDAKLALESAWATVEQATKTGNGLILTRNTYEQIKHILEIRVITLAKTIDTILDILEGHKDRIPDQWIDDVEEVESDYKNWVVEAERLVRLYEWQAAEIRIEAADATILLEPAGEHNLTGQSREKLSIASGENELVAVTEDKLVIAQPIQNHEERSVSLGIDSNAYLADDDQPSTNRSITSTTHIANGFSSIFGLLPPILLKHKGEIEARNVSDNQDTLLLSEPSTKVASPQSVSPEVTPPTSKKAHQRADSSPLDADYTSFRGLEITHGIPDQSDSGRDLALPLSRSRAASDGASHQHHMDSLDISAQNHVSTLNSGTKVESNGNLNPSADQETVSELSSQLQIEEIQQELDDETASSAIGSSSPSLMVRKVRLQNNGSQASQLTDDKMTAKISRLLKKIPAPIQLTDHLSQSSIGPGADGKSSIRSQQPNIPPSGLTLEPVPVKTKSTQLNDLGVRVYHLHQAGREVPIKLFIRLVGTEERVMVRVGGGWADLAEYLKEYAIHHGRRSVSNNNFELAGSSPAKAAANSIFSAARSPTSSSATTPVHRPVTPSHSSTKDLIAPSSAGSNRSTDLGQFPASRARSASPLQEDEMSALGLGGPKSKNIELSPQKRAWVDGMLGQARQLSSEHRKIDEIGDLGKAGSTKRVFLRATGDSSSPR